MVIILVLLLILLVLGIIIGISQYEKYELRDIETAKIQEEVSVFKEGYPVSGYSWGSRGGVRVYHHRKNTLDHIKVKFLVHYNNGETKVVFAEKGTKKYDTLMWYVGQLEYQKQQKQREDAKQKDSPTIEVPPTHAGMAEKDEKKTIICPKYLNIKFEVLPNEFSLEIRHPTCSMKLRDEEDGKYETDIRFELHYDPEIKGVTNRVAVVSLYNKDGQIMAIMKSWYKLDKSGCKVLEFNFWKDINDEPEKAAISLERYN